MKIVMNAAIALVLMGTLSTPAFAKSKRIFTCKGTSSTQYFTKFRINVLQNTDTKELRATLSEGYTTMNTSNTWDVVIKTKGSSLVVTNTNKTSFLLVIDAATRAKVDDVDGLEAETKLTYVSKAVGHKPKTVAIEGRMACRSDRKGALRFD